MELYRRLLQNCPETDASPISAKFNDMLHDAISFYENLITNLEKYFDFNFRFYATEGNFFLLRHFYYVIRVVKWIAKIAIIAKLRIGGSPIRKQRNRVSSLQLCILQLCT